MCIVYSRIDPFEVEINIKFCYRTIIEIYLLIRVYYYWNIGICYKKHFTENDQKIIIYFIQIVHVHKKLFTV